MSAISKYVLCVDKKKSVNAKALAENLDAQLLVSGAFPKKKIKERPLIINYGRTAVPVWYNSVFEKAGVFINRPSKVAICVNKEKLAEPLIDHGIDTVVYYPEVTPYLSHILNNTETYIVARSTLTGFGGKGISIIKSKEELEEYEGKEGYYFSIYFHKTHEFRVHVAFGKAIGMVQKKRMGKVKLQENGLTKADPYIRSHSRGWVFAYNNLYGCAMDRAAVTNTCVAAVNAIGLDFGAVDVMTIFNKNKELESTKICEINTAPGLDATPTMESYIEAINNYTGELEIFWENKLLDIPGSELIIG